MSIHRKLTTTCCVAVLALGLAACGSDDDKMVMEMNGDGMEPMDSTAAEQLANAQAAVADAQTMVAALAADSSPSDRAAAYAALAGAQSVLAEASGIPENEIALLRADIARLHGDIDKAKLDAQAEADRIAAEVETEKARLQGDIDKAKLDAQAEADRIAAEMAIEAARIVALVDGTKEAETKRMAIATEAMGGIDGIGGCVENVDMCTYSITIKRDRDGTKITITDTANPAEADPANPQFVQVMDLGGGRTMHTRTMDADANGNVMTEVVIVSTDIEAPEAMAFTRLYTLDANPKTTGGMDHQSVMIDPENEAMIATDGITAVSTTVLSAVVDDGDETVAAYETDATFDGAPGTLKCAGDSNCMVTLDAAEGFDFGLGWEFTPADGATVDVVDTDHLRYGFWLQKRVDEDGVPTYDEVETFADSSVAVSGGVTLVTGSATYNGGATGVYVHSEVNSDGSRVATTAGQFAADATLTATFGQVGEGEEGTIAPNMLNTVTGSISNFELENDEEQQWSVALKGDIDSADGTVGSDGTANGGGDEGSFTATFHGPTSMGEDNDVQPSSVVGEFGANFNNGAVAGAFGARK